MIMNNKEASLRTSRGYKVQGEKCSGGCLVLVLSVNRNGGHKEAAMQIACRRQRFAVHTHARASELAEGGPNSEMRLGDDYGRKPKATTNNRFRADVRVSGFQGF